MRSVVLDGQQTGVLTKKFVSLDPRASMKVRVKGMGVIPPSSRSWSSVSRRTIFACLQLQEQADATTKSNCSKRSRAAIAKIV